MQEKLWTERQREGQTCDIVQFLSFLRVQKGSYNFLQRSIFTIYQRHVSSWQYNYVFCRALRVIYNKILKITCFTSSIQMGQVMFFVGETSLSVTNFSSAGFIILKWQLYELLIFTQGLGLKGKVWQRVYQILGLRQALRKTIMTMTYNS